MAAPGQPPPLGGRRIVTENVKDFRPLLHRAEAVGTPTAGVLFTSGRFPRGRRHQGRLIAALDAWLVDAAATRSDPFPLEGWLVPAIPDPSIGSGSG